ncbi:hypothetical protein FQZ97_1126410 [compost metagenome]
MRSSSVGASSGMAETLRVSAAWEMTADRDRAIPATAARERLNMGILRFNSGKGRRIIVIGRALGSFTLRARQLRCAFRQPPGVLA